MAITSTSASSSGSGLAQLQMVQARRAADQAEVTARALKKKADSAQEKAQQETQLARDQQAKSDKANLSATDARQKVHGLEALRQDQAALDSLHQQISSAKSTVLSKSYLSTALDATGLFTSTSGNLVDTTA